MPVHVCDLIFHQLELKSHLECQSPARKKPRQTAPGGLPVRGGGHTVRGLDQHRGEKRTTGAARKQADRSLIPLDLWLQICFSHMQKIKCNFGGGC